MGQARLPVRKIREVLRLKAEGFSDRQIATTREQTAVVASLSWHFCERASNAQMPAM